VKHFTQAKVITLTPDITPLIDQNSSLGTTMKHLSLKEAAARAGLSKVTLWRIVQKGELTAHKEEHAGKERYLIDAEVFHNWLEVFQGVSHPLRREDLKHLNETIETPLETPNPSFRIIQRSDETPQDPPETTQGTIETMEMIPADLHKLALESMRTMSTMAKQSQERADSAQRQLDSLTTQLFQYRQTLTEQAESLQEKATRQKHLELLAEENARQLADFEATKTQLQEQLVLSQKRVAWLEKRVPNWLRKLLRA
jgi:excisionase family DNA binding protein